MEAKYTTLSNNEKESYPAIRTPPSTRNLLLLFGSTSILIAVMSSIITSSILLTTTKFSNNNKLSSITKNVNATCGTSVAEALANGCIFDAMTAKWEAPECYDADLLTDVWPGPWNWYADANHTIPVSREEVEKGLYDIEPLYMDHGFHVDHCMYMWMKQHRAYLRGAALEEDLWYFEHTLHCAGLTRGDRDRSLERIFAGFAPCRSIDMWKKHDLENKK